MKSLRPTIISQIEQIATEQEQSLARDWGLFWCALAQQGCQRREMFQ
jgi:hypothetical protein